MRRLRRLPVLLALPLAAAEPRSPHDVTTYGVVYRVPGMDDIAARTGLRYGDGDLALDLYLPPGKLPRPVPAVIFANVTGLPFTEWEIYRDWGRLVAAHGMAGVVYRSSASDPRHSLEAVVAHVTANAAAYGIDASRLGVWACSANVTLALPWLMEGATPSVKAAVLYYGATKIATLRKDLPVYYVLAGRDAPELIEGMRSLFARAAREGAPWTMVSAPGLTHAFDALDEGTESRRLVGETVAWLVDRLVSPPASGPEPSRARRALTHVFGREYREAAASYRQLLEANPKDAAVHRALAMVLLSDGRAAEAVPALRAAAADAPEDAWLRMSLGHALAEAGEVAAGLTELKTAVEKGTSPRAAYVGLGTRALQRRDTERAIALWEAARPEIRDAAARRTVLYNLACAYARREKGRGARPSREGRRGRLRPARDDRGRRGPREPPGRPSVHGDSVPRETGRRIIPTGYVSRSSAIPIAPVQLPAGDMGCLGNDGCLLHYPGSRGHEAARHPMPNGRDPRGSSRRFSRRSRDSRQG